MINNDVLGKVLIFGGTGMIGSQCQWPDTVKYNSKQCDIADYDAVASCLQKEQPKVVVLLAAKSNLSWCETNPHKAAEINIFGTTNVALVCRALSIKLVFMSSMAIFPDDIIHEVRGNKVPVWYPEDIVQNAPNVYGKAKLLGEQIVRELCPTALIIRPGRMFGGGHKYDSKFVRICYETLASGRDYSGYVNHYCSLTYIPDLWNTMQTLLQSGASGIWHIVNGGPPTSLYDICLFIKERGQLPGALHQGVAKRGENGYIATANQSIHSSINLRSWQDVMIEYLEILKNEKNKN